MYKLLTSKGQLFAIVLGLLSILLAFSGVFGLGSKFAADADLVDVLRKGVGENADEAAIGMRESLLDMFTMNTVVPVALIGIALILAILFGLFGIISNPKGSMKIILGMGLLLALFFIFSTTSGAETSGSLAALAEKFNISDGVSAYISGGIKTAMLASVVAFFGAIIMEVLNIFK